MTLCTHCQTFGGAAWLARRSSRAEPDPLDGLRCPRCGAVIDATETFTELFPLGPQPADRSR